MEKLSKELNQIIEKFCNFIKNLPLTKAKDLQYLVDTIYEQAVDAAWNTKTCALICKKLADITVSANNTKNPLKTFNFRELLIDRCQREFEENTEYFKQYLKKIKVAAEACTNLDRKNEILLLIAKKERIFKMRALGNIRFIGELFIQSILPPKVMIRYILNFLNNKDDHRLECLCELLKIVGEKLESTLNISCFFVELQKILDTEAEKFSNDTSDMLREVIHLRNSKWVQTLRFVSSLEKKETVVEQSNMRKINTELNGDNVGCDNKEIRKESDSQHSNIDKIKSNPNGENVDCESQTNINEEIKNAANAEQFNFVKIESDPDVDSQRRINEEIAKEADVEQLDIVKNKSEPDEENVDRESQRNIYEAIVKEADAEQLKIVKIKSEPDEENDDHESQRIINEADAEQTNIVIIKSQPDEENFDRESQRFIDEEIVNETDTVVVVFILIIILLVYNICGFFTC